MALLQKLQGLISLLLLGHAFLGINCVALESCEAVIPTNTIAHLGDSAVLKCRQTATQNMAWTFSSSNSASKLIATNCKLSPSAVGSYRLDTSSNSCNLIIDKVTPSHLGSYTCTDITLTDSGHTVNLGNTDQNLALLKNTTQASTYVASTQSRLVVDGSTAYVPVLESCAITGFLVRPWWAVDLGQEVSVGRVRVTGRGDCCPTQLENFYIGLTNISPWTEPPSLLPSKSSVCKYFAGHPFGGVPLDIFCEPNTLPGRYLFIMLTGTEYLTLCEVEAYYK